MEEYEVKIRSPFFSDEGLTSTSANHVANIAKEYYQSLEAELDAMNFIKSEISIVGSIERTETNKGTPDILNVIDEYIEKIVAAKSLIGWLREAIKLKVSLDAEISHYVSDDFLSLKMPESPKMPKEEDILEKWDIKERERYISLEAECSEIGKYIHPRGAYSKAKKEYFDKTVKPVETTLQGRDSIITYYTPIVDKEMVESKFFELQKRHREAQAELNSLKHRLKREVDEETDILSREYMKKLEEYKIRRAELEESDRLFVKEERKRIEKLKIVIPQHHRRIYDIIMGK